MRAVITWMSVCLALAGCASKSSEAPPDSDVGIADSVPEVQAPPAGCVNHGTDGATSRCLAPTMDEAYYVDQALRYFDTLDVDADPESVPDYSDLVARWEWPPWLLLTGYGAADMIEVSNGLKVLDPSTVPSRDCRFFPVQPFARCRVEFEYANGPCPIYEEFTFNNQGQMTFIEAWSDLPGLVPLAPDDPFAESTDFPRLSTRIPGLGNESGRIDPGSIWMEQAAAADPEIADFALRTTDWWTWWMDAVNNADENYFAKGCGWRAN